MKKVAAEPYRDIDFSQAKQGPVVKAEPGQTKISIRLDNSVIEAFRRLADQAGGGKGIAVSVKMTAISVSMTLVMFKMTAVRSRMTGVIFNMTKVILRMTAVT